MTKNTSRGLENKTAIFADVLQQKGVSPPIMLATGYLLSDQGMISPCHYALDGAMSRGSLLDVIVMLRIMAGSLTSSN